MSLLQQLSSRILIGDGAMGTLLYEQGIDQCFEKLNATEPNKIIDVHKKYVQAGADIIQTNTYAANRLKLAKYGLADEAEYLNEKAVELAKEAANEQTYVVGTVGGLRQFQQDDFSLHEIKEALVQQVHALLKAGVDGLLFETFYDFEEAKQAVALARQQTDIPIIMNVSIGEIGVMNNGHIVADAFKVFIEKGANVVGLNCRMGPFHMLRSFETIPLLDGAYFAAYPNASLPERRDGRILYEGNADYFQTMGKRFVSEGVRLLGGCCGTTPAHIASFAKLKEKVTPITSKQEVRVIRTTKQVRNIRKNTPLQTIVKKRPSVIVELDPPKQLHIDTFLQGAKALHASGVDAITMADSSLASPRVDNMALGTIVKEQIGARPLVHLTCRDRNLIGLQSHLMGLDVLGLHDILAITGDPTKIGDFPGAASVYDVNSFQLITLIKQLNEGISFSGKDLGKKTNFQVAAAFNPNVRRLDRAVERMEKKIECGADYFMTQPIYDISLVEQLYDETKHIQKPIYVGVMPLTGTRNAEFLHNEVPGIQLTDDTRKRMAACGENREAATKEGIAIAKSLIDAILPYFNGIYLITPFLRYDMTVQLTKYIQEKQVEQKVQ